MRKPIEKHTIKNLFHLLALTVCLSMILGGRVTAQTFTTLHSFTGGSDDGANPVGGLIVSGNTLYGTAQHGGLRSRRALSGLGIVFAINTDGTGFTTLHSFNGDGFFPSAGLILSGNTLYGTAPGANGGTVYEVNTSGTSFATLYSGNIAADSVAGLTLSGSTLYGTTAGGGSKGFGTVFAVNTDGTGCSVLHSFSGGRDGINPEAGLVLSGDTLYGTTAGAPAPPDLGTLFRVNIDGTGFRVFHRFTKASDGANPLGELILSGNAVFGTTYSGGSGGAGTVFRVQTDGSDFTTLYSFTGGIDGANPSAGLIRSGNSLYGTAAAGGGSGKGVLFMVNTDGTGFATLYNFTGGSDGTNPNGGLVLSGNSLYGITTYGGSYGYGTLFSLSFAP